MERETEAFRAYMADVDRTVQRMAGLGVYDLPDFDFRTNFEAGIAPEETAREALEAAGWEVEE